jgi:hypothetical protein
MMMMMMLLMIMIVLMINNYSFNDNDNIRYVDDVMLKQQEKVRWQVVRYDDDDDDDDDDDAVNDEANNLIDVIYINLYIFICLLFIYLFFI